MTHLQILRAAKNLMIEKLLKGNDDIFICTAIEQSVKSTGTYHNDVQEVRELRAWVRGMIKNCHTFCEWLELCTNVRNKDIYKEVYSPTFGRRVQSVDLHRLLWIDQLIKIYEDAE